MHRGTALVDGGDLAVSDRPRAVDQTNPIATVCAANAGMMGRVVIEPYVDARLEELVVEGDADHPANFGRLCSKGRALDSDDTVHCYGLHSCKGQSDCSTAEHACKGQNECKGQGACGGADHDCAGKNECKGKGGVFKVTWGLQQKFGGVRVFLHVAKGLRQVMAPRAGLVVSGFPILGDGRGEQEKCSTHEQSS